MAEKGRCAVCGKSARQSILRRTGGLCWNCAHPDFRMMAVLVALMLAALGAIFLIVFSRSG